MLSEDELGKSKPYTKRAIFVSDLPSEFSEPRLSINWQIPPSDEPTSSPFKSSLAGHYTQTKYGAQDLLPGSIARPFVELFGSR